MSGAYGSLTVGTRSVLNTWMGDKLYKLVTDDDGAEDRYKGISEKASEFAPQNFGRQVMASVASKTGDLLTKPGLVLTWLLTALGAPSLTIGLLVPVREAGALLPQVIFANFMSRYPRRKHFWVVGSLVQGFSILGIAGAALLLEGSALGWTTVGLLVVFSLARSVCSIASKELLGKTIPESRRGRLGGLASSISGWIAVLVGVFYIFNGSGDLPLRVFAAMLLFAGALWIIGAFLMSRVEERRQSVEGEGSSLTDILASFRLLRSDTIFLRFCIARGLLASTTLSMPFYVVLAHKSTGGRIGSLGILMVAASVATAMSGVFWGRLSDSSSRKTLAIAGVAAGLIGLLTAGVSTLEMDSTLAGAIYGFLFYLLGLSHTGIRNGRKTYLVDYASEENRAQLVAVSNTLMGLALLVSGAFGLLAEATGERVLIVVFAVLGLLGGAMAFKLPESNKSQ